jgi:hypothetical protein
MLVLLLLTALAAPIAPVPNFEWQSRARDAFEVLPKQDGQASKAFTLAAGETRQIQPFPNWESGKRFEFVLTRGKDEVATLKLGRSTLESARRPIRIKVDNGSALIYAGSRRLRVIFLPRKTSKFQ